MILESILASVVAPAAIDMIKSGFGAVTRKFVGITVDDQIKLQTADTEKLKALSSLDTPIGVPSQWVVDLRASFRYLTAGVSILSGVGMFIVAPTMVEIAAQLITMPFGFIFGERMYLTITGKPK